MPDQKCTQDWLTQYAKKLARQLMQSSDSRSVRNKLEDFMYWNKDYVESKHKIAKHFESISNLQTINNFPLWVAAINPHLKIISETLSYLKGDENESRLARVINDIHLAIKEARVSNDEKPVKPEEIKETVYVSHLIKSTPDRVEIEIERDKTIVQVLRRDYENYCSEHNLIDSVLLSLDTTQFRSLLDMLAEKSLISCQDISENIDQPPVYLEVNPIFNQRQAVIQELKEYQAKHQFLLNENYFHSHYSLFFKTKPDNKKEQIHSPSTQNKTEISLC